jgi:hypothetical protein
MRFTRFTKINKVLSIFAAIVLLAVGAAAQSTKHRHCQEAGGMLMTNLGAIDSATTMGPATGDLKGAVGATILSTEANGNTLVFHVQHHWVTEAGDTLAFDPATATTTQVSPGLYAVVTYPAHLTGGTGSYAHASGDLNFIGEADLNNGQIVLRYSGQLCFGTGN